MFEECEVCRKRRDAFVMLEVARVDNWDAPIIAPRVERICVWCYSKECAEKELMPDTDNLKLCPRCRDVECLMTQAVCPNCWNEIKAYYR